MTVELMAAKVEDPSTVKVVAPFACSIGSKFFFWKHADFTSSVLSTNFLWVNASAVHKTPSFTVLRRFFNWDQN
jgi:hypothetical protein